MDLCERVREGVPLLPTDFVISADEKTIVQAHHRKQATLPGASGRPMRVEHEDFREGVWTFRLPGTFIAPNYSVAVRTKVGSPPPTASWLKVMTEEPH